VVDLSRPVVVAVLTRAPSAGGKRRLFAALKRPVDASLIEALLLDTLDGVAIQGSTRVVAVEPGEACDEVRDLVPRDVRVVPQSPGGLGDRMRALIADLLAGGADTVVLVGSDLPDITTEPILAAVSMLRSDPTSLVLGPATDGGYYLVGATRVPEVFDGIDWGSSRVLDATLSAARTAGIRVHLLEPLSDVDTLDDLLAVTAPRTRAWAVRHVRG
jgi:hypothetical protein